MKFSRSILSLTLALSFVISSCSITVNNGTENTPQTTVFIVTATQAEQAPAPTATQVPEQPAPQLPPPPTASPTATPQSVLHFYVSGYVWSDHCTVADGPKPSPLPTGCVDRSNGSYGANGIFDSGEFGIPGVVVKIELNCNYGAFTAVTDASGHYSMSFTVDANAGVSQQLICLSVDALDPSNVGVLIPGGWSSPLIENSAVAVIQITIPVETQNTVNFGWDYQHD